MLNKVQQERNKLQDAHAQLGEELKGVPAELSGSVKENQRLRRGIYSKCLSELLWKEEFGEEVNLTEYVYMYAHRSPCGGDAHING